MSNMHLQKCKKKTKPNEPLINMTILNRIRLANYDDT